jgi:hypothetical protein
MENQKKNEGDSIQGKRWRGNVWNGSGFTERKVSKLKH